MSVFYLFILVIILVYKFSLNLKTLIDKQTKKPVVALVR